MYMMRLLFTFGGTIRRGEWWIGTLTMLAAMIACMIAVTPEVFDANSPPRTMTGFVLGLAFTYPAAALMVKRIADIGWPRQVAYGAVGLSLLSAFADYP